MDPSVLTFILFAGGAMVILVAGISLVRVADALADRTGLGEAVTGALLLGGVTSLPGLAASLTGAWNGFPQMAVSNAVGGIAAQTVFLVVADFTHKSANLEHAAASQTNLFQGALLMALLALPLLAANADVFQHWRVHPASVLMVVVYFTGVKVAAVVRVEAMWRPKQTVHTREDVPEEQHKEASLTRLTLMFVGLGLLTALAGWIMGKAGVRMITDAGWKESLVGGVFTALASSLPELVTTVAAVRRGAFTLAVSGIVGGNAFDTLFVAASDVAYGTGSIYHAMGRAQEFMLAMSIVMTAILVAGLIRRERSGPANIGTEGVLLILCYLVVVWVAA